MDIQSAVQAYIVKHGCYPRSRATKLQLDLLELIKKQGAETFAGKAQTKDPVTQRCHAIPVYRFQVLEEAEWIEVREADGFTTWWRISSIGEWVLQVHRRASA